jgi:LEA14-like dessication related protein
MLLALSSCKFGFKQPEIVKIQDLTISEIKIDNSKLLLSIIVKNPNNYPIRLKELDVQMLDPTRVKVGEAKLKQEIDLPANKNIQLDFLVNVQSRPMIHMVSSINKDLQFFIAMKGKGRAKGISKSFEFEQPYSIDIKEYLPQFLPNLKRITSGPAGDQPLFKLLRTYVGDYGITKTGLMSDFIVINPYGLSFKLKGFPAELFINGKIVGTGNIKKELVFDENVFYRDGTMVFQVSNLKSVVSAAKGVFQGGIDYEVRGTIQIQVMGLDLDIPYAYLGVIPFSIWEILLK